MFFHQGILRKIWHRCDAGYKNKLKQWWMQEGICSLRVCNCKMPKPGNIYTLIVRSSEFGVPRSSLRLKPQASGHRPYFVLNSCGVKVIITQAQ
jgi:hypothetical protein